MVELITCEACEAQISPETDKCPKCGHPTTKGKLAEAEKKIAAHQASKRRSRRAQWIVLIIIVVVGLTFLAWYYSG